MKIFLMYDDPLGLSYLKHKFRKHHVLEYPGVEYDEDDRLDMDSVHDCLIQVAKNIEQCDIIVGRLSSSNHYAVLGMAVNLCKPCYLLVDDYISCLFMFANNVNFYTSWEDLDEAVCRL